MAALSPPQIISAMDIEDRAFSKSTTMIGYFRIIATFLDEVGRATAWTSLMPINTLMQYAVPTTIDMRVNGGAGKGSTGSEHEYTSPTSSEKNGGSNIGDHGASSCEGTRIHTSAVGPTGMPVQIESCMPYDNYGPVYHQDLLGQQAMRPTVGYSVPASSKGTDPKQSSGESGQEHDSSLRGIPGYLPYGWAGDTSQTADAQCSQQTGSYANAPSHSSNETRNESTTPSSYSGVTESAAPPESYSIANIGGVSATEFWAKLHEMRMVYMDKLREMEPYLPIIADGQRPYLKEKFLKHVDDVFGILELTPGNALPPSLTMAVLEKACRFIENVLEVYKKLVQKYPELNVVDDKKTQGGDGSVKSVMETQNESYTMPEAQQQDAS